MLKRLFVEDATGTKMILFVDKDNKACYIDETAFDKPLTLETAQKADYSNFDNCKTAEEAAAKRL